MADILASSPTRISTRVRPAPRRHRAGKADLMGLATQRCSPLIIWRQASPGSIGGLGAEAVISAITPAALRNEHRGTAACRYRPDHGGGRYHHGKNCCRGSMRQLSGFTLHASAPMHRYWKRRSGAAAEDRGARPAEFAAVDLRSSPAPFTLSGSFRGTEALDHRQRSDRRAASFHASTCNLREDKGLELRYRRRGHGL